MKGLIVTLGTCGQGEIQQRKRWVTIALLSPQKWEVDENYEHNCTVDHVEDWPGMKKVSSEGGYIACLSFSHSQGLYTWPLILDIKLEGAYL